MVNRLVCCVPGLVIASTCLADPAHPSEATHSEVAATLRKVCGFYRENCAKHGGYVWRYSKDLTLSEGEAGTDADMIWVQPPGTPAIGEIYLNAYQTTGEFFILAQMPEPQPAWAQQYDVSMHPCWDRKMEPPAISGLESQYTIEVLLLLYRMTGQDRFLEPVPAAIDYLRRSLLPNGRLARFYELETNRPLYVTDEYELTYDSSNTPSHYGFEFDSRHDEFQVELGRLQREGPVNLLSQWTTRSMNRSSK